MKSSREIILSKSFERWGKNYQWQAAGDREGFIKRQCQRIRNLARIEGLVNQGGVGRIKIEYLGYSILLAEKGRPKDGERLPREGMKLRSSLGQSICSRRSGTLPPH